MNFQKIKGRSLRYDQYIYLDHKNYKIDDAVAKVQIPLVVMPWEAARTDDSFVFCIIRVRKRYRYIVENELFPTLHNLLWQEYGGEYLERINMFTNLGVFRKE